MPTTRPAPDALARRRRSGTCDVSLYEIQGQERVDQRCAFLRAMGRRLREPVVMTQEGDRVAMVVGPHPW
jgi:hypothetical protein